MNTVSRRGVIGVGLAAVAAATGAALLATPAKASLSSLLSPAAEKLTRSRFAGSVGDRFTAVSSDGTFPVVLASIADLAPAVPGQNENRFNLIFESSALPAEGIYSVTGAKSGSAALLLTPIGAADGPRTFQALVNNHA